MNEKDLERLRNHLLKERQDILGRFRRLEAGIEALQEPQIEMEEEAQKLELTKLFSQLGSREREAIESIELALEKIQTGKYGICEECGDPIPLKRLLALPAARLCRQDADEMEKTGRSLPPAGEIDISELP